MLPIVQSREFSEARAIAHELGLRRLEMRRPHPELARRIDRQ